MWFRSFRDTVFVYLNRERTRNVETRVHRETQKVCAMESPRGCKTLYQVYSEKENR